MATTIGTEARIEDLLQDLISLDHDAVGAYEAAIARLENAAYKRALEGFCADHRNHIENLGPCLTALGGEPPKSGSAKSILATGKVVLGGLIGDKQILMAMKTNEDDTNTAYERAVNHRDASGDMHAAFERGLADERRHRDWMVQTLATL